MSDLTWWSAFFYGATFGALVMGVAMILIMRLYVKGDKHEQD